MQCVFILTLKTPTKKILDSNKKADIMKEQRNRRETDKTWQVYFVKRQINYFVIFYNLLWKKLEQERNSVLHTLPNAESTARGVSAFYFNTCCKKNIILYILHKRVSRNNIQEECF